MIAKKNILAIVALSGLFLAPQSSCLAENQQKNVTLSSRSVEASSFIDKKSQEIIAIVGNPSLSEAARSAQFRTTLLSGLDMAGIGKRALGPYWRQATPEQLKEYLELAQEMVFQVYYNQFKNYSGEVVVVLKVLDAPGGLRVMSRIDRPSKQSINVEWFLVEKDGSWKINDVIVDNISLTVAQQKQFISVIQREGGISGLLAKMREKYKS